MAGEASGHSGHGGPADDGLGGGGPAIDVTREASVAGWSTILWSDPDEYAWSRAQRQAVIARNVAASSRSGLTFLPYSGPQGVLASLTASSTRPTTGSSS